MFQFHADRLVVVDRRMHHHANPSGARLDRAGGRDWEAHPWCNALGCHCHEIKMPATVVGHFRGVDKLRVDPSVGGNSATRQNGNATIGRLNRNPDQIDGADFGFSHRCRVEKNGAVLVRFRRAREFDRDKKVFPCPVCPALVWWAARVPP